MNLRMVFLTNCESNTLRGTVRLSEVNVTAQEVSESLQEVPCMYCRAGSSGASSELVSELVLPRRGRGSAKKEPAPCFDRSIVGIDVTA